MFLRDDFLALGFLLVFFFAAVFFKAGFFNAAFRFSGLALMAECFGEFNLAAPFSGVVVSNSYSDSDTA